MKTAIDVRLIKEKNKRRVYEPSDAVPREGNGVLLGNPKQEIKNYFKRKRRGEIHIKEEYAEVFREYRERFKK